MRKPGRPPLDADAASSCIHVRVTAAQRLELRRVADENGTGLSGIIREAVNVFVADYRERPRRVFARSPKL